MNRLLLILLGASLLASRDLVDQSKSGTVQGVWQALEVTITGPTPRTVTTSEPRPNLTILTARHYARVQVESEGPRPTLADAAKASADELRNVWGPFYGEAGTYEVDGNIITMRPVAAKNPAAMAPGAFSAWSYKLEGDTVWLTASRNQNGAIANPVNVKLVRGE
jgi:hypothetical protein